MKNLHVDMDAEASFNAKLRKGVRVGSETVQITMMIGRVVALVEGETKRGIVD
jgi:hypothetical protein